MPIDSSFKDQSIPGGIVHNPASAHAREMARWEMGYSPYGPPGRPREVVGHQMWPAMFYKMKRSPTNGDFLVEHYQEACNEAEAYNLEAQGYRMGQTAAIEYVKGYEQEIAVAAAERNYRDQGMSENAKAESARAEEAASGHLAEVPRTPIKPRGRPKKAPDAE